MPNAKRQAAAQKEAATRAANKKAARRADERLGKRLTNEAHLLRAQINPTAPEQTPEQAPERAPVQAVFRAPLDDLPFGDRPRTPEPHSDEVVSSPLAYRSPTDDKTVSWNRPLIRESTDSRDESIGPDQPPQTPRHPKAESSQSVLPNTPQSNQTRSVSGSVRHSSRTPIPTRRFEELTENQLAELREQSRYKRRLPPPKPIHQTWGPNDVRQRVTLNRTQDVADTQQNAAQRAAFGPMNPPSTPANENAMKSESNAETENDDERVRRANANAHYVTWTREQYPFRLKASLRIYYTKTNAKIRWTNPINSPPENNMHDNWIKDRFNVETLELQIENAKTTFEVTDLTEIAVTIKTNCHNVPITRLTLPDLLIENWIVVKTALTDLWRRNPNYELEINVRCESSVDSTLNAVATFTVVDAQRPRQTKTVQLEATIAVRNEQREETDDYRAKLINDFLCNNEMCNNEKDYCYRKDNNHFRLTSTHLESWANAIPNDRNDASIDTSPALMLDHMKRYDDSVDTKFRASLAMTNRLNRERKRQKEKKRRKRNYQRKKKAQRRKKKVEDRRMTREDRLRDETFTKIELRRINSSVQISSQYASQMYNQFFSQYGDYPYPMPTSSYQSQSYPEEFSAFVTQSPSQIPLQLVSQMTQQTVPSLLPQATAESIPQRKSSPIEIDDEEKRIIENYWRWKFFKKKSAKNRNRLVKTKHLLDEANLSIANIKKISTEDSRMQIWALNQNIPLNHINRFDENFRKYKPLWREAVRKKKKKKRKRIQRKNNDSFQGSDGFLPQFPDDDIEEIDWFNIQNRRFLWQMNEFWIVRIRNFRISAWCERCRNPKSDFEAVFVDFVEW